MVESKVFSKLLTVDGVDEIGKSAMVEALRRAIKNSRNEKVAVLSVTEKLQEEKNLLLAFQKAVEQGNLERMQNVYLATYATSLIN